MFKMLRNFIPNVSWSFSSCVTDVICFASVYHINMDCLSTTPTQSLIRHAILSQTGPPQQVDSWAQLWEYSRKVFFPRTQQYITQFRTESGGNNLPVINLHS